MADTTIVFFGLRIPVAIEDIEALENSSFPEVTAAKKVGLEHYWGNFGAPDERYCLFVGKMLGKLGVEDKQEIQVGLESFVSDCCDVSKKLMQVQFGGTPQLYIVFQPDP